MSMRNRAILTAGLVVTAGFGLGGCSSDSTDPGDDPDPVDELVISGVVQNNTVGAIPDGARVLIAWTLLDDIAPPYWHVFGEGSIDAEDGTFQIALDEPPPATALLPDETGEAALGVGIVLVTTDASISTGDDLPEPLGETIIGAAEDYAVIYLPAPLDAPDGELDWMEAFDAGYGVGVRGPVSQGFETFVPTSPQGVVLVIDDLGNLDFVNWG